MPVSLGCLLLALSFVALGVGQKAGAALVGVIGLMQFAILPALWKRHKDVKQGLVVYVAVANTHPMRMPQFVSIAVVLVVTAFVGLCSAFIIYVVRQYFNTQTGWTVCGVTLLAIWLFVGYCWYRIFTEKPTAKPVLLQEQTEGVWPPPPRVVKDNDKDLQI